MQGKAGLALWGDDFRTAFGNATGQAVLWTRNAEVAAVPVEAIGLDLGEIVATRLTEQDGDRVYVAAPCMVAALEVKDGVGHAAPIVADTEDSLVIADGVIDLRNEGLALDLDADAKDPSWGRLLGDVRLEGSWRHPAVSVDAGGTAVQALFAGLLGSVAGPLAALPFIETGDGEGVDCGHVLTRAGRAGIEMEGRPDRG